MGKACVVFETIGLGSTPSRVILAGKVGIVATIKTRLCRYGIMVLCDIANVKTSVRFTLSALDL